MTLLFPLHCLTCGSRLGGDNPFRLYCCNAHRQSAYRSRSFTPHPAPVQHDRNTRRPERQPNNSPADFPVALPLNSNTYAQLGRDRC